VMAMRPGMLNERQRAQAEALQRAEFAIQNGLPLDAERIAREILTANAGHPEATKIFGYALLMQERADEAVAPLEKAARATRNPEIETQLAIAFRHAGNNDKALLWLRRAIKRTPPFAPAFHELGYLLHVLNQPDEAIDVLRQGTMIAPMMTDMWIQLGFVCNLANDRPGAADAFSRALAINPVHPDAVQGMALVLMHDGDYARAAELFKSAIAANPDNASARVGLGNCLLELGESDAAYACLRAGVGKGAGLHKVLKTIMASGRGRFWLRPSDAAKFFKSEGAS
jgi:tetratricopeptide (TPR) repeat protein